MSCRVIGRQIEKAFISRVFENLSTMGYKKVYGEYLKTNKNSLVKDFYNDLGFMENGAIWTWDLSRKISIPNWLK